MAPSHPDLAPATLRTRTGHAAALEPDAVPTDLRLVVTDMDGTLLDGDGEIPSAFWPLHAELKSRGIVVAVASGRQYATLAQLFGGDPDVVYIAENGAQVVRAGAEVHSSSLDRAATEQIALAVRRMRETRDVGLVWCGRDRAYVERADATFVDAVSVYYKSLETVDDLTDVDEPALQLAFYDFEGAHGSVQILQEICAPYRAVVTSGNWIDIIDPAVHKGVAVRALMQSLGLTADQVAVFGDYLNDVQMLGEASYSFAMANAHPDVLATARFVAPSNREHGVLTTLTGMLDAQPESIPA